MTRNGSTPAASARTNLDEAIDYERTIAAKAAIERQGKRLTRDLFTKLRAIAREPLPGNPTAENPRDGFLDYYPAEADRPAWIGPSSLQVLVERMDNVFTPHWWGWRTQHVGVERFPFTVAHVIAWVGPESRPLIRREAWGGINGGKHWGDVAQASATRAGKRALAYIGPGHECWLNAHDFDPDSAPGEAEQRGGGALKGAASPALGTVSAAEALKLHAIIDAMPDPGATLRRLAIWFGAHGVRADTIDDGLANLPRNLYEELLGWLEAERVAA